MKCSEVKKFLLVISIFLAVTFAVPAEQLSQIGVIDLSAIVSNYFKESKAWRELEEMTRKYEEEKARILDEIQQLEGQKLEEENEGNESAVLRLEDELYDKKEYLKEYNRIRFNQIQRKRDTLLESPTFLAEIMTEIRFVAESEGYSLILRTKDPDIMWWSPEVDITDKVLARLRRRNTQ
ncbi:MAG: OmpH family outer membrane protein [Spirochaetia bacterium]